MEMLIGLCLYLGFPWILIAMIAGFWPVIGFTAFLAFLWGLLAYLDS